MFGELTKTSSRIAIAAALGLVVGGFAFKATPARAADLGGDCCADLEERVAELEATTVRKGNKKVSVTLSGWVVKSFNVWDDGDLTSAFVGDKGYDLGSRFAITGSATIAPGWSAGFNLTVLATSDLFATAGTLAASNQFDESGGTWGADAKTLYSFIYIKSDKWGTLNWGKLSPASDNPAVLADISGTVIESNSVFFEGASFQMRAKGANNGTYGNLSGLAWQDFLLCQGLALGIGTDCFGAAMPAVRYDSPTWGGFRFETSWGKQDLTGGGTFNPTPEYNFWDIAAFYTADWNSIKLSVAAAYTWQESSALYGYLDPGACDWPGGVCYKDSDTLHEDNLFQIGASILHKPSGLGIYGMYQTEKTGGSQYHFIGFDDLSSTIGPFGNPVFFKINNPETDAWYVKPFWRKTWTPAGATTIFGEYGQYNDQFNAGGGSLCGAFDGLFGTNVDHFCNSGDFPNWTVPNGNIGQSVFVTGSEVQRWGLGVVQEINSAAMHVFARWQHQTADVTLTGFTANNEFGQICPVGDCPVSYSKSHVGQSFDDWDLFQVGGIIFF